MNFTVKHKQAETQEEGYMRTQLPDIATNCRINASPNSPVAFENVKSESTMTFSQQLEQSQALEIAEEFEQAIEANSIERINRLFDKVLEQSSRAPDD